MGNGEVAVLPKQQNTSMIEFDGSSALEMEKSLTELSAKLKLVKIFIKSEMQEGLDYGEVPGTKKRTLYQPGADKLNFLYGYARQIIAKEENKDFKSGHYDVTVKVQIRHKATQTNTGEGEGSCSTYESKYRYRWVYERDLPRNIDKESLVSKEYDGKNGPYLKYRIENTDLFDQWNTVLKMAVKRAYVAATLAATGLSGIFSLDEDDLDDWIDDEGKGDNPLNKRSPNNPNRKPNTSPSNGSEISQAQMGKIFGDARGKGLSAEDTKTLAFALKQKPLELFTKKEASELISFLANAAKEDLMALVYPDEEIPPSYEEENP